MNLIIKGFIIGIGKIIPGVSGAMLAMTLGIYEQLIESIANIKKDFLKNAKILIKPGIGIIIAITLTSKIVVKCLNNYYLATMLLFIGMIVGGIPQLIKQTKLKKQHILRSTIILIAIYIIIKNINIINNYQINYTILDFIKIIGIGILDAISSIIPGISGTAILMMLGYYNTILETFATILHINKIARNIFIITPFIIGFAIGTLLISKIINIIIKKQKNLINIITIIFMTMTIITLIKKSLSTTFTTLELIIGIILFIIGIIISIKLDKNT